MGQILSYKHGEDSIDKVDPRLWDIVQHAIAVSPYDAQIRSGSERSGGDLGNHSKGYAVDVTLIDPETGKKLPDFQNGETFSAYEQYAQTARVYQMETYPELNNTFRWGGYFSNKGSPFGGMAADLMHLDITPSAKGRMALGSWEGGAKQALLDAYPGAKSNGGLGGLNGARLVSAYKTALRGSGGLVPPGNIPGGNAPIPAPRSMIEDVRAGRPVTSDYVGSGASFDEVRGLGVPPPRARPAWGMGAQPAAPMPMPQPADRAPAAGPAPGDRMTPEEIAGLYEGILPFARPSTRIPSMGIVDAVRSPTLFEQPNGSQVVGIPDELDRRAWDERRVDPKQVDFDVGGFGSLLDDRMSPGAPNASPRSTNFVRPSGPVGGLPGAPTSPIGSGAPVSVAPFTRPALRPPEPVGSGAPVSLEPFARPLSQVPKTQFGGEGMPTSEAGGGRPVVLPANLIDLMEKNNPPLPRPRPDSSPPSPVGSGAPIDITPFTTPRSSVPRPIEPAAVPEWITVTRQVPNPARSAIRPVPLEQTIRVENGIPVGIAPRISAPPPSIPETITITERVRNPAFRAPVPAVRRPLVAPIPAMQSEALLKQRLLRPPTVASTTPLQRVSSEQTNPGVGGTTRSMEQSDRWRTGY